MDEISVFILTLLIFIGIGFVGGSLVGEYKTNINNTDLLCKQIKTQTSEYLACKQKEFSEVIKGIKVEE